MTLSLDTLRNRAVYLYTRSIHSHIGYIFISFWSCTIIHYSIFLKYEEKILRKNARQINQKEFFMTIYIRNIYENRYILVL